MKKPAELHTDPRLEAASAWCLRLAEGGMPPSDQARFEAWLEESEENRAAFEDAVGVWRGMGEASLTAELIGLRREALTSFERANRARWRPSWPGARIAAVAAVLAVAVVAVWLWSAMPTTYRTAVGERRVVVLNDGSRLSLDAATEVKVRYVRDARRLQLERGRAKFDVAHDPARPFTVTAADKIVRATGTAFSVELLQGQVRVVLYEGHVVVLEKPGTGSPRPLRLASRETSPSIVVPKAPTTFAPGAELVAPVAADTARIAVADPVRSLAWEGGQLVFEDEPLAVAVERVNRYSGEKLVIGDPAAGAVRIDGVFAAGDTEAFIEGVTGVFPVRARQTPGGRVLVSRP